MYKVTLGDKRHNIVISVLVFENLKAKGIQSHHHKSYTARAKKDGNHSCVLFVPVHLSECISFSLGESEYVFNGRSPVPHIPLVDISCQRKCSPTRRKSSMGLINAYAIWKCKVKGNECLVI